MLRDEGLDSLTRRAYETKVSTWGRRVALRGLVEFSNVCEKNCLYCGIRRGNASVVRYRMDEGEIVDAVAWAAKNRYGSVVLQSGEIATEANTAFVERVLQRIRERFGDSLGVTLSLGEQSEETYRRWKDAGAHRYLLRIETSNPELYARIHPTDHSWQARLQCLRTLKRLGFITGTGVMIGLPGQEIDDLARDVVFFRDEGVDMVGMGPYLVHPGTPLAEDPASRVEPKRLLELTLRMIAATRLTIPDANIAATTALQAIDPEGREKGLLAGANVVMPNVTPLKYRGEYILYPNKPCIGEESELCRGCLERRVRSIGEEIAWGERGDPIHFRGRAS
jgi:biotin synthase